MSHSYSESDVEDEKTHFTNVITTFQNYAQYSLSANNRRRKDVYTLPAGDQALLAALGYRAKLDAVDAAIAANADFLAQVVADPEIFVHSADGAREVDAPDIPHTHAHTPAPDHGHEHEHGAVPLRPEGRARANGRAAGPSHSHSHGHAHSHGHDHAPPDVQGTGAPRRRYKPTEFDMDKLRSTLKQLVRDWSAEGEDERNACYRPMTEALLRHFAHIPEADRSSVRVLVPGAGLGRLAHDVARLGFASQGNEFSHYMILCSHFILNRTTETNAHAIFPYVHSFSNIATRDAMLRPITIPDVLPSDLPAGVNFSLVAGDFEEIYGAVDADPTEPQSGLWDAVLTCFFIDTAKNIVNYLRIIHRILAPGGVWINLGPLLWHWENNNTHDPSVELSLEEVKALARAVGFRIENERTVDTTYTNNRESMLGYVYRAAFWTATKPEPEPVK
ncbi:N2227-domain-containing protein [Mycena pura]|uniref:carnosine N-methyltransferase n=1 Tax=Mycena pura TaxID=153505 RepID=A0AAD6UMN8_9AGAR|nr:N2227-domain-containing protein [Mycena pura]